MQKPKMKFPLLLLDNRNGFMYSIKSEKRFHLTGEKIVADKTLIGCQLIDIDGNLSEIIDVKIIGWGNIFRGYSLFFNQRSVKVDFDLNEVSKLDLKEFKRMVIQCLEVQKNNCGNKDADEYLVADELIELTNKSNHFEEIINGF